MKLSPKDRIIVAVDVNDLEKARTLMIRLMPLVSTFKAGLELLMAQGARRVLALCRELNLRAFADAKLKDIGNTVSGAARVILESNPWMVNVHLLGTSEATLKGLTAVSAASVPEGGPRTLVIGVTVLTDVTHDDLVKQKVLPALTEAEKRLCDADQKELKDGRMRGLVCDLAVFAQNAGLDGVVASAQEAAAIRKVCGPGLLIVTPAIRPHWAVKPDEQKRVTTPAQAVQAGADYLVIGRPITDPPDGIAPEDAIERIAREIAEADGHHGQQPLPIGGC